MNERNITTMKWIDEHVCSGDATSWFHVDEIPEGLTLEQAVEWIVNNCFTGYGYIKRGSVYGPDTKLAETEQNKITTQFEALEEYKDEIVERIRAVGGWGNMTYYITTKEKDETSSL